VLDSLRATTWSALRSRTRMAIARLTCSRPSRAIGTAECMKFGSAQYPDLDCARGMAAWVATSTIAHEVWIASLVNPRLERIELPALNKIGAVAQGAAALISA
jgi:hypothetical protein